MITMSLLPLNNVARRCDDNNGDLSQFVGGAVVVPPSPTVSRTLNKNGRW